MDKFVTLDTGETARVIAENDIFGFGEIVDDHDEEEQDEEDEMFSIEEPTECGVCGGDCGILGTLGKMIWLSCRNCGMQFGREQEAS